MCTTGYVTTMLAIETLVGVEPEMNPMGAKLSLSPVWILI